MQIIARISFNSRKMQDFVVVGQKFKEYWDIVMNAKIQIYRVTARNTEQPPRWVDVFLDT